ncbi:YqgE/AlgH family protein [Comamonas sp. NLF-1-9]|uniref:YqgE/AlgH family protein n=1 Tax=Comamonas sp. NLF-1-9 TaxID=2853163 RepID=UPI001C46ED8A|nr:YqgE/AlgH family protein [Comamonas sp. NLF-1-9]QXL84428.1 YqgE/AlgH family protein [Comamonas sp. NLF-1-9]
MSADSTTVNLTNHFLIAMPGLRDQTFAHSVVYVCEHGAGGALGLVINKPTKLDMQDLFERVDLSLGREDLTRQPVFHGGPVQMERGFVLHEVMRPEVLDSPHPASTVVEMDDEPTPYAATLAVPGGLEMTTSRDVLEALSHGAGPRRVLVMLGYSAWGEGQLESELAANAWLTVLADPEVIFEAPIAERYDRALALLGVSAARLSPEAGRA